MSNVASSNNTFATVTFDAFNSSNILRVRNFSFSLPVGATPTRIKVDVEGQSSSDSPGTVTLAINSAGDFSDQVGASGSFTLSAIEEETSTVDLTQVEWGTSLTRADINAATFAVDIQFSNLDFSEEIVIDAISVSVTYTT
jgi:hypothetical protein